MLLSQAHLITQQLDPRVRYGRNTTMTNRHCISLGMDQGFHNWLVYSGKFCKNRFSPIHLTSMYATCHCQDIMQCISFKTFYALISQSITFYSPPIPFLPPHKANLRNIWTSRSISRVKGPLIRSGPTLASERC